MSTAPITWADVVAYAAEMFDVPESVQDVLLEYVNGALNPKMFTVGAYKFARLCLAAHVGTDMLPGNGGESTGPVLSETVGGISRTYADLSSSAASEWLAGTTYGASLTWLLRTSKARIPRVI